jgi:hypothetical protein
MTISYVNREASIRLGIVCRMSEGMMAGLVNPMSLVPGESFWEARRIRSRISAALCPCVAGAVRS